VIGRAHGRVKSECRGAEREPEQQQEQVFANERNRRE
jgi:hypothetical protein